MERDTARQGRQHSAGISTHTLTWSVTIALYNLVVDLKISTHTLTWSVTLLAIVCHGNEFDFNSHAHVERDRDTKILLQNLKISTHTLTWSVTRVIVKQSNATHISTHTLTWSVTGNVALCKIA